jgi:putative membrane protein
MPGGLPVNILIQQTLEAFGGGFREVVMDRRTLIQATIASAVFPGAAAAQTSANAPTAETRHAAETLEAGTVSLETSKAALDKTADAALKRFAEFEVAEQETVAKVMRAASKMPEDNPLKLSSEAQDTINKLKALPAGKEFDMAYFKGQMDGHTKLLKIQETYMGAGKDELRLAIAMLARGHIQEHLANLEAMKKTMPG